MKSTRDLIDVLQGCVIQAGQTGGEYGACRATSKDDTDCIAEAENFLNTTYGCIELIENMCNAGKSDTVVSISDQRDENTADTNNRSLKL